MSQDQRATFDNLREAFPDITQSIAEQTWIEANGDPDKFSDVCLNIQLLGNSTFRTAAPKPTQQATGLDRHREELLQQEFARQREVERQIEAAKQREAERQREIARQAELAKRELERQAELARKQELERQAELARKHELERQAELARKQEFERQAELARRQQAELARKQELERQAELAQQRELELQAERIRKQELERQAELIRKEELERLRVLQEEQRRQQEQAEILAAKQREQMLQEQRLKLEAERLRQIEERQKEDHQRVIEAQRIEEARLRDLQRQEEEARIRAEQRRIQREEEEERHRQKAEQLKQLAELERVKYQQEEDRKRKEEEEARINRLFLEKQEQHQKERRQLHELEASHTNFEKLRQQQEEKVRQLQTGPEERTSEQPQQLRDKTEQEKKELEKLQALEKQVIEEAKRLKEELDEQMKELESLRKQREQIEIEKREQEKFLRETEERRLLLEQEQKQLEVKVQDSVQGNSQPQTTESSFSSISQHSSIISEAYNIGIIQLFIKSDQDESIEEAKKILLNACPSLESHHFLIQNYSRDLELMALMIAKANGEPTLAVSINSHFVGDLEALKKLSPEEILAMLNEKPNEQNTISQRTDDDEKDVELGVLDKVLNITEFLVSGVSTLALLPVTAPYYALSIMWSGLTGKSKTEEKYVDFEVIHTNWYWRHLNRVFRFTDTKILRLHPKYLDNVRAAHEYNTVESLELVDPQNLIIRYNDSSPADYLRAKSSQIQKMVNLIVQRTTSGEKPRVINPLNVSLSE